MPLKRISLEVTDDTPGEALGARWKDGVTIIILNPGLPPTTGFWDTDRPGDIDSNGGSDRATYFWSRPTATLELKVESTENASRVETTLLTLKRFREITLGLRGIGYFKLHGRLHEVTWRIQSLQENTPQVSAGDDNRYAQSARAHIKAAEANPKRKIPELTQAEAFARLIVNKNLQVKVMDEIFHAHRVISTIK
jgi:hypothetical protein